MDPAALATMAAAPPPPGQVSNFVNPPSQQNTMIAVCTVMIILTLSVVILRLYSNFRITKSPGAEDYICLIAMIFSFTYIGFVLDLSYVARHMWDVPGIWFTENYWKIRFAQNTVQAFAFFTSRLPIFLLYLRLFGRNNPIFRLAVYFGISFAFLVYMSEIPLIAYYCAPRVGGSWSALAVFAKCKKLIWFAIVQGGCNIATDLYIFLLPLRIISHLQLQPKKKLGIYAIFGVGLLAVIASAISLYYRYQLSFGTDVNWNEGVYIATAAVEINIAIICSSMPPVASFIKHTTKNSSFFIKVRSRFTSSSFFSTTKLSSKQPRSISPYAAAMENSERSMDLPLTEHGYVELQNVKTRVTSTKVGRKPNSKGIQRTVEVEIV